MLKVNLSQLKQQNNKLQLRIKELEELSKTDGEVYNRGRHEGWSDIISKLRHIVDPTDKHRLNADGILNKIKNKDY
jgi:hypothetical protein